MNRILITDITSCLAVNLALELVNDDINVVYGVQNDLNSDISNLYLLLKNPRFNLIQCIDKNKIPINSDYVIKINSFSKNSFLQNKVNFAFNSFSDTQFILDYCQKSGSKLISVFELNEDTLQDNDINIYSKITDLNINLTLEYCKNNKIYAKIITYSNLFGKYFNYNENNFISDTIKLAFMNKNIPIKDDISANWTFASDLTNVIKNIMFNYFDENIIAINSKENYSKSDIANYIIKTINSSSQIIVENKQIPKSNSILIKPDIKLESESDLYSNINEIINYIKLVFFT